jgi:hypothetical protein
MVHLLAGLMPETGHEKTPQLAAGFKIDSKRENLSHADPQPRAGPFFRIAAHEFVIMHG